MYHFFEPIALRVAASRKISDSNVYTQALTAAAAAAPPRLPASPQSKEARLTAAGDDARRRCALYATHRDACASRAAAPRCATFQSVSSARRRPRPNPRAPERRAGPALGVGAAAPPQQR